MKRGRRKQNPIVGLVIGGVVILGFGWILWPRATTPAETETPAASPPTAVASQVPVARQTSNPGKPPRARTGQPSIPARDEALTPRTAAPNPAKLAANTTPKPIVTNKPTPAPVQPKPEPVAERIASAPEIERLLRQYQGGQKVAARDALNSMLAHETNPKMQRELRKHLRSIADDMIFGPAVIRDDALITRYVIKSGDNLDAIAKAHNLSTGVVARINNIQNVNAIRAGQSLKMPVGPFHAVVFKADHRLDLYLQGLYVRSFRVALGKDNRTPTGTWLVNERLPDPAYNPPASATDRRKFPGGHPDNPLGKFWVGLSGIEGDTVGEEGFGVHGTNDPASIGQDASLGCVRMLDDDIALIYDCLAVGKSKVATWP